MTIVEQGSLGTATVQPDGTVDYQAGAAIGVDRFTYTVADATGLVSNTATVRVNVQGDLITITRAVFRTSLGRWVIDGTNTVVGPGNEVTVVLERTGGLIGTVPVDAAGNWSIRTPANLTTLPQDGDRVLATSTAGGTARRIVSLRP